MKKAKYTVREFIHSLNCEERDVDVYVDCIDRIAVCGGEIALTPEGMEKFGHVLEMEVEGYSIVGKDEDYDLIDEERGPLWDAWEFLFSLAGYCSCEDYEKWFEGDDAELI